MNESQSLSTEVVQLKLNLKAYNSFCHKMYSVSLRVDYILT